MKREISPGTTVLWLISGAGDGLRGSSPNRKSLMVD
jgi:hypothetical protein